MSNSAGVSNKGFRRNPPLSAEISDFPPEFWTFRRNFRQSAGPAISDAGARPLFACGRAIDLIASVDRFAALGVTAAVPHNWFIDRVGRCPVAGAGVGLAALGAFGAAVAAVFEADAAGVGGGDLVTAVAAAGVPHYPSVTDFVEWNRV